jgi:Arc/MetJ family transcription regulator
MSIREIMKTAGVTLHEVAVDSGANTPDVCRILDDDLVERVRKSARKLVHEKHQAVGEALKNEAS